MTAEKRNLDTAPQPAKLTARDFWLLADNGAFDHHARTELIEGEIWVVNSIHRWHARTLGALNVALSQAILAAGLPLEVLVAGSVSMSDDSVPEPDLSVIAPIAVEAETIGLDELRIAVEISDSTAAFDLGRKARLYARHGVPEYWVILRGRGEVIQMWAPGSEGYAEQRAVALGQPLASVTIEGIAVEAPALA